MKARKLHELFGTNYIWSNHKEYIAVGSSLCHDLISVNKKSLTLKYALDAFNEGRKAINNKALLFIWDKLLELIETGEIQDIINGKDILENPLSIYTVIEGKLEEHYTDAYGWPNTTDDGICMNNDFFKTKKEAIEHGIKDYNYSIQNISERITEKEYELTNLKNRLSKHQDYVTHLESLKSNIQ